MIYFISDSAGHVKIGVAKNPSARMRTLQTGHPTTLVLLASVDWPNSAERRLHSILKLERVRGEWFRHSGEIASLINHIHAGKTLKDWARALSRGPSRLAKVLDFSR